MWERLQKNVREPAISDDISTVCEHVIAATYFPN